MRKKVLSAVLAATMVAGMMGNVVSVSAEEKYDLTLYSVNNTDPAFDDWLANVEEATGLNINVIAAPTDTDTRQQKITTILSTGDSSVDVIEINDEMSAAFKNSGWLEGLNDTVMTDDIIDQFVYVICVYSTVIRIVFGYTVSRFLIVISRLLCFQVS